MYAGGENNIPEGGKKAADLPVCDPSVSSCPDAAPTEAEWSLPSGEGVCEEAQPRQPYGLLQASGWAVAGVYMG